MDLRKTKTAKTTKLQQSTGYDNFSKAKSLFSKNPDICIPQNEDGGFNVIIHDPITTGYISLDKAFGGGFPAGKITEIVGREASGKTTLCLHAMIEAQKRGEAVAFIDVEHTFNFAYAEQLGLDLTRLFFSKPKNIEETISILAALLESKLLSIIVVDSVPALITKADGKLDSDDKSFGITKIITNIIRRITPFLSELPTALIFLNRFTANISTSAFKSFNEPTEIPYGGNSLKYSASLRVFIRTGSILKQDNLPIGNVVRFIVDKSKQSAPKGNKELLCFWGTGLCPFSEVCSLLQEFGLLKQAGSWYYLCNVAFGQGFDNVRKQLSNKPNLFESLKHKVKHIVNPKILTKMASNKAKITNKSSKK